MPAELVSCQLVLPLVILELRYDVSPSAGYFTHCKWWKVCISEGYFESKAIQGEGAYRKLHISSFFKCGPVFFSI